MIKTLAQRGASVSAIARQAGVDRKTVRKALHQSPPAPQSLQPPRNTSLLDAYKDFIKARLDVADFTAQRLFQDIRQQGYTGSYDLVKRFVCPLRQDKHRRAVVRFETLPGQQAQVDWAGSFGSILVDGVQKQLSCFSMILGFSRYQYIEFTVSRNLAAFLSCHVHAFEYFGGVPSEILYDNLKTAVLSNVDGVVEYLPRFSEFACSCGFSPRVCRPYRAQTKGKVERPFPYIRSNFFIGTAWDGLPALNAGARKWLQQTANCRIHGTTGERPCDRFARERTHLRALPARKLSPVETVFRSATRDCVISYGGNFYSVPHVHACRRNLRVEVSADELCVYHNHDMIARHGLCQGKHRRIMDPKHLEGLKPETCFTPTQKRLQEIRSLGPTAKRFVDGLVRAQTKFLPWHLCRLEEALVKTGPDTLQKAMEQALCYDAFDARTIQNLCQKLRPMLPGPTRLGNMLADVLARSGCGQVESRNLAEYDGACQVHREPAEPVVPDADTALCPTTQED